MNLMNAGLSERQVEARSEGEQKETVKYLNRNHIQAMLIFMLILVSAGLLTELVISISIYLFGVKRDQLTIWMWTIISGVFLLITYVIIRYIVKVPLTSAFGF